MLAVTCEGKLRHLNSCLKGQNVSCVILWGVVSRHLVCCSEQNIYLWTLWFDFEKL